MKHETFIYYLNYQIPLIITIPRICLYFLFHNKMNIIIDLKMFIYYK